MKKCQTLPYILNFDVIECVRRNRRPQANKTLETTSPSTPLEKFIPKQKKVSNPQENIVNRTSPSIGSSHPKQTPSKPQANPKEAHREEKGFNTSPALRVGVRDPVIGGWLCV